tara:strand:+ start:4229 stop:5830 length:1602 start_codon:yes stop_codon:yes gene_type:complete
MIRQSLPAVFLLFAASPGTSLAGQDPSNNIWNSAQRGQFENVRDLLDGNPALRDARDDDQRTPLHLATRYGHLDIVKLLLARGAAPDRAAYNQFTPLHMAVHFNRRQILDLLLQQQVDVNAKTSFGLRVVDLAARDNRPQLLERLLERGAADTLYVAACRGDLQRTKELLKPAGTTVTREALLQAIRRGHAEVSAAMLPRLRNPQMMMNMVLHPVLFEATEHVTVVQALIAAGEDPAERADQQGMTRIESGATVLHVAAARGHLETVGHLLTLDAFTDRDVASLSGRTPAHEAAAAGHLSSLQALHKHGASLVATDKRGRTCVHFAAEAGHAKVLLWLVQQGKVLHGHDDAGRSALALATKGIHPTEKRVKQRIEAAWVLVRHGVPVDLTSAAVIGDTASAKALLESEPELAKTKGLLVRAISFGSKDIVALLLDAGCDVNTRDERKTSALHWCALWRQPACAQLLIDRGADVHASNKFGYTPLHDAARANCAPVAKLLLAADANPDALDKEGKAPRQHLNSYSSEEIRTLLK